MVQLRNHIATSSGAVLEHVVWKEGESTAQPDMLFSEVYKLGALEVLRCCQAILAERASKYSMRTP